MGVYYRQDRGCYYYRFTHKGKQVRRFGFKTKAEAREAEGKARREQEINPLTLGAIVAELIARAVGLGRSLHRIKSMRCAFYGVILPYFGRDSLVTKVTPEHIEQFAVSQVQTKKANTVWHYVTDLKVLLGFAVKRRYLSASPASGADLSMLRNRRPVKRPLDPRAVEAGAAVLIGTQRAYYNFVRFTGTRMDEANRVTWQDIDFEGSRVRIPGTKTYLAETWQPVPSILIDELRDLPRTSQYVFPGRKGDKVYSRRRLMERVKKAGIKLTTRDLRDYYITEVASHTDDAVVIMKLARHSNLGTTTKYLRTVHNRMRDAVTRLGDASRARNVTKDNAGQVETEEPPTDGRSRTKWPPGIGARAGRIGSYHDEGDDKD